MIYGNEIAKSYDKLKISIINKAARVSGEFDKVTIGPRAFVENGHPPENKEKEDQPVTSSPSSLNGSGSSRSNITFSIKKILLENEVQRREKVKVRQG